jgi:hypothetical protein
MKNLLLIFSVLLSTSLYAQIGPDGTGTVNGYSIGPGADLSNADLINANLRGADLTGAYLRDANLERADLRYVNLRGAILEFTNLHSADLSFADLSDAYLDNADLSFADLSGANLSFANLRDDVILWETIWSNVVSQSDYDAVVADRDARPTQASYDAVVAERDIVLATQNSAIAGRDDVKTGSTYQVIEGDFSWHEAKVDAYLRGGRLAVLDNERKINAANLYLSSLADFPHLWIGLTDEVSEGNWKWITGEPLSNTYWRASGEPSNMWTPGVAENYVVITASNSTYNDALYAGWNDIVPESGMVWLGSKTGSYLLERSYYLNEVKDLRAGSTMIEIHDGQATLTMEVEESDDLGIWTNGGTASVQINVQPGEDKKFFRFKMDDSSSSTDETGGSFPVSYVDLVVNLSSDGSYDFISVSNHPLNDYNGVYFTQPDLINNMPYFKSSNQKYLYFYKGASGGLLSWSFYNALPDGISDLFTGGWIHPYPVLETGNFNIFEVAPE